MTQAPKSEEPKSQDKEKPSFSDKAADILLKVIMAGRAAGGTIGAGWSLFKESDVPKAIASAVIGLGISYGANLLKQKQIYVECLGSNGNLDGKHPGDKIWAAFGNRVGWRNNDECIKYLDVKPSLSSPQGILPWFVLLGG